MWKAKPVEIRGRTRGGRKTLDYSRQAEKKLEEGFRERDGRGILEH